MYFNFKLHKLFGRFFNLSVSGLSTSDFQSAKSVFFAKYDVSIPVLFLNLLLLHN